MSLTRCSWCEGDALYEHYHDTEWGVAQYNDRALFEMLNLEGAQAGLSWITVLRKRDAYRAAFDEFDPAKIAKYSPAKRAELLANPGIIRNKLKVNAFIVNAQLYLAMMERARSDGGPSFSEFLWSFVGGSPIINHPQTLSDVPSSTSRSDAMSKALKKLGFKFVGSTICYAFMQASGMVVDHTSDCFLYQSKP